MSSGKARHPLKEADRRLRSLADARPGLVAALAGVAALGMGALLVWFLVFSGLNEPVPFIYDGF
ncbi:hypothetical protein [Thermophilibacter immobilis]|jgi:hypothetical protein|uniref:Uncharacterized protein n=1 Tax=Thermophilibacter immobilis TaxID=2779519 RepID=A0A7S7M7X3_9ACTN|nr:hypothetical protein [Thermophilibacter immobilis]QOY60283.1 hypothetical protein INP52_07665 [Thermophilibacter immobilis]